MKYFEGIITQVELIERIAELLKQTLENDLEFKEVTRRILSSQEKVNEEIFFSKYFSMISYNETEIDMAVSDKAAFIESVGIWAGFVKEVIAGGLAQKNYLDASFYVLMSYYDVSDEESIVRDMINNMALRDVNLMEYSNGFCDKHSYMWGHINPGKGDYEMLYNRAKVIKEYKDDFLWLYDRLGDYRSRVALYAMIKHWLTFDPDALKMMNENSFYEYVDLDLLDFSEEEVIVDCGAFDGDTAKRFADTFPGFKKMYCYEASSNNFKILSDHLASYDNVVLKRKAVGSSYTTMTISDEDNGSSLLMGGDDVVDVVPIDDDIKEPVTLIKMDIEGAEQDALLGAKNHIINERPKLIICVYHGNKDIVEIPKMIEGMRDDYKFYLRHIGLDFLNVPVDIALYAL